MVRRYRIPENLIKYYGVEKAKEVYYKQNKNFLEGRWINAGGQGPNKGSFDIARDITSFNEDIYQQIKKRKIHNR